jgi:hypothetical protein
MDLRRAVDRQDKLGPRQMLEIVVYAEPSLAGSRRASELRTSAVGLTMRNQPAARDIALLQCVLDGDTGKPIRCPPVLNLSVRLSR